MNPLNPHAAGVSNGDTTTLSPPPEHSEHNPLPEGQSPFARGAGVNLFYFSTFPLSHQPTISLFTLLYHSAIIRITT